MRVSVLIVTIVGAIGFCGIAIAQASSEELVLQAKVEQWTFWMMVTGAASAFFGLLGFIGLLLTLREQRNLTHSQERAVLEFMQLRFRAKVDRYHEEVDGDVVSTIYEMEDGWSLNGEVRNVGRTHANRAVVQATILEAVSYKDGKREIARVSGSCELATIQPGASAAFHMRSDIFDGRKGGRIPWNPEELARSYRFTVRLRYRDVFGRRHDVTYPFDERQLLGHDSSTLMILDGKLHQDNPFLDPDS